jgi:hypothetical protein
MLICQDTRITCFNSASGFECFDRCKCWSWDQLLTYKCQECLPLLSESTVTFWPLSDRFRHVLICPSSQRCILILQSHLQLSWPNSIFSWAVKHHIWHVLDLHYCLPAILWFSSVSSLSWMLWYFLIAMIAYFLYSSQYVCYCHL